MTYRSILDIDGKYKNFEKTLFNFLVRDGLKQNTVKEMPVAAQVMLEVKNCYERLINTHDLGNNLRRQLENDFNTVEQGGSQNLQKLSAFCDKENEKDNVLRGCLKSFNSPAA